MIRITKKPGLTTLLSLQAVVAMFIVSCSDDDNPKSIDARGAIDETRDASPSPDTRAPLTVDAPSPDAPMMGPAPDVRVAADVPASAPMDVGRPVTDATAPDSGSANPNAHAVGDKTKGRDVFRFATFGSEGFWTDAAKLPKGIVEAKLTPIGALKAGLHVDIEALDKTTVDMIALELKTDLSPAMAPILNNPATTIALINANAVIGVSVVDSNNDGKRDVLAGDKVGVTCAACHAITDKSVFDLPNGGSIGKRIDGPATHSLNVGAILALAANTRAFFPMAQLQGADGKTIGKAPKGLTKDSTEEEFDAYFSNPTFYPVGSFDDTVDGNGNPMHNTPMFRTDLAAPWGSAGEFSKLDQFSNTVYTVLLDPTNLLTDGGKAFIAKVGGAAGTAMLTDYAGVLAATGVTGFPYVKGTRTRMPGDPEAVTGLRVDNQQLLDMSAYLDSLRSPKGAIVDPIVAMRAKTIFVAECSKCHNVDQTVFVNPDIIEMKALFPGDAPVVLATREAPLGPISNTPGDTFDDKQIVINATLRGLKRGGAMPLLMDLARKPVFLHDSSVPTLDKLLDPSRGATAPHPFYLTDAALRMDMVSFLKSLDDTSK